MNRLCQDYSTLPDTSAEPIIFERISEWDKAISLTHTQLGIMVRDVRDRMLWQYRTDPVTGLPCRSWTRWLQVCAPYGYSTLHAALAHIEALKDIPDAELTLIPNENLSTMRCLSTGVRCSQATLDAAKSLPAEQFDQYIADHEPDQHISKRKPLHVTMSEDEHFDVDKACQFAIKAGLASNKGEAIARGMITAMEHWQLEMEVEDSVRAEA